jgi:probable HAF family extracellular repeat protein
LKTIVGGHLIAAVAMAQSPTYKVIDLGTVGPNGQPFAITKNGMVAGAVQTGNTLRAVLWYKGKMIDLGNPGLQGPNSQAFGVNYQGQVVGEAQTTTPDPNGEDFCGFAALGLSSSGTTCFPFLWQNGVMHALPVLGGNNGWAFKINIRGAAAGTAENDTPDSTCPSGSPQKLEFKPVVWNNGPPRELPTDPGDPDGSANAINDLGQAAGASGECAAFNPIFLTYLQPLHALFWEDGKAIDLGTLGGTGLGLTPFNGNQALDLNNRSQVVGSSDLQGDANFHAFLWTRETGMRDLGTVPGDANSIAIGINDAGQVVGVSLDATLTQYRAFLLQDGNLIDLNTLVPAGSPLYLATACKINAAGEIIGIAIDDSGNVHGYLAVPNNTSQTQDVAVAAGHASSMPAAEGTRKLLFQRSGIAGL